MGRKAMFVDPRPLHEYWFHGLNDAMFSRWRSLGVLHIPEWRPDAAADCDIKARFSFLLDCLDRGQLQGWLDEPQSSLAYVIAADTVPRCIHRSSSGAYAFDALALAAVNRGMVRDQDKQLQVWEKAFFYMPLVHDETPQSQNCSLKCHEDLAREAASTSLPPAVDTAINILVHSAQRHARIVQRFGRFPHRNTIMGRESRADELAYLADPWAPF